jgi:hypothetical protein
MGSIFSPKMPALPPVQPLPDTAINRTITRRKKIELQRSKQRSKEKEEVENQLS